jgi:hypothetical protein
MRHLVQNYDQLMAKNETYFIATFIGQDTHKAQTDAQLCYGIANALDKRGHLCIVSEADSYTINKTDIGVLLSNLLVRKSNMDTQATASQLRAYLVNLDSYISTINSNIELFNQHVHINHDGLTARGGSSDYLITNSFKACLCVTVCNFSCYICNKKYEYYDGEDFSLDQLLTMFLVKFQILKDSRKWNLWHSPQR